MQKISNGQLSVLISEIGAELKSIKKDGREYLYQGNQGWKRQAPVLFPWAGKLKDYTYTLDGETYHLAQHGFVRDMPFVVEEKEEDRIVMSVSSTSETLLSYPREFKLTLEFSLKDTSLAVKMKVENLSGKEMPFGCGFHPGFIAEDENAIMNFEPKGASLRVVNKEGVLSANATPLNESFTLSQMTDNQTFIIGKADKASFTSSKGSFSILTKGWDYFVYWRNDKDSFFCPEVWANLPSLPDEEENFNKRTTLTRLEPNGIWRAEYILTIQ